MRNEYTLDVDAATEAIRWINSSRTMLASECLLDRHFIDVAATLDKETVAQRVVLIDALWGTRLYMERGAADRIVKNLSDRAVEIVDLIQSLPADALEGTPKMVSDVARKILPAILQQTSPDAVDRYRRNYSFATKFFHWTTRRHFPIVDRYARKRINEIQRQRGVRPRVRSFAGTMNCEDEYERWLIFYSDFIYGLLPEERERLRKVDHDSQVPSYRTKNSLLRILDKVFYVQGGGSGLGRVEI